MLINHFNTFARERTCDDCGHPTPVSTDRMCWACQEEAHSTCQCGDRKHPDHLQCQWCSAKPWQKFVLAVREERVRK